MNVAQRLADDAQDASADQLSASETDQLLLTSISYEVVSDGYRVDTPIVHIRGRTAAGRSRHITVEGFRPYLAVTLDDFREHLHDITSDRRVMGVVTDCSPVLWPDIDAERDPASVARALTDITGADIYHESEPFTTLDDTTVARVVARSPSEIGGADSLRETLEDAGIETYEADIPFERRFAINTGLYRGVAVPAGVDHVRYENWPGESRVTGSGRMDTRNYDLTQQLTPTDPPDVDARMIVYDIEVSSDGMMPDPARAQQPITAITAYDSYDDAYRFWGLVHDSWVDSVETAAEGIVEACRSKDGFPDDVSEDDPDLAGVELYYDETALLSSFHDYVLAREPDIFTGWNASGQGGGFDTPYLIQRSYNVQARQIVQYSQTGDPAVWTSSYGDGDTHDFVLQDIVTLDLLDAYQKTQYRELDSYALDDVAQAEVGFGKTGLDHDELDETWAERPIDFFTYNIRDTQATVAVEREVGLLDLFENLREVTGASYGTAVNNGPMLDTMFLRRAYEEGLVLPTNTEPDESVFHGATVFEPEPGVHTNAVYPDLSSMYPSLMSMLNLGTETIVGTEADLAASEYSEDDVFEIPVDNREFATVAKGESIDHIDRDAYKGVKTPAGNLREMFEPQYDTLYVLKPDIQESFIQSTIDELIQLKNEYTGSRYAAVKRVTNSCFTPDTEVMTPEGVRSITDIAVGDTVYSVDPETNELEYKEVTELIEKPDYRGELVDIENQHTNLKMTPDHRVMAKRTRRGSGDYEVIEAGELNETTQYELPHSFTRDGPGIDTVDITDYLDTDTYDVWFTTDVHGRTVQSHIDWAGERQQVGPRDSTQNGYRVRGAVFEQHSEYIESVASEILVHKQSGQKWIPKEYDGTEFLKFLAWYITEGSTYKSEKKEYEYTTRGVTHQIDIAQYPGADADAIAELLDSMGFDYYDGAENFQITSQLLCELLENSCGDGSSQKQIPEFVFDEASLGQKKLFHETLMRGDGDARDGTRRYSTKSTQLRDDFMRLCFECGYDSHYSYDSGVWRVFYCPSRKKTFRMYRDGGTSTAERGVYCVQVEDNHTLLAGRDGKFSAIPNCYGVMGDSASAGVGFRLYDRKVAEGITLAGRLTIQHTADEFTSYLQEHYDPDAYLVGGDTDSCVSSMPNAETLAEAWEWARDAVEHVDESYDEFVQETFGFDATDEHRLEVELESLASALFYPLDSIEQEYVVNDDGLLESVRESDSIKKRYAQHVVWDDDDGWLDTADDLPLHDPDDESRLKRASTVSYETYDSGPLQGHEPAQNVEIKGFEYVRSDSAQITRDAQLRVLSDILLAEHPAERIETYVQDLTDRIRSGDVPLADLGRPKGISQHLDEYGWTEYEELSVDRQTERAEQNGGAYVQTPSPTYRGAKYATEHIPWEDLRDGGKPYKYPVERVRPVLSADLDLPETYQYETFPEDDRPDPLEVGMVVDAIAVDAPDKIPDAIVIDRDTIIQKALRDRLDTILRAIDLDWTEIHSEGQQSSLAAFA